MTYIVGAGLAGQIAQCFFPEAKMIAEKVSKKPIPFWFWDNLNTRNFFKENDISYSIKIIKVGYIGKEYALYNKITNKTKGNYPCDAKKQITVLEPDHTFFFKEPLIKDSVIEIKKDFIIGKKGSYRIEPNEQIIWTAHTDKTIFLGEKTNAEYKPITYIYFRSDKQLFPTNLCYLLEKRFLNKGLYRATKLLSETAIVNKYLYYFECTDFIQNGMQKKYLDYIKKEFECKMINCKVFSVPKMRTIPKEIKTFPNIYFVGRYAESNHDVKSEQVIAKLYSLKNSGVIE